jgi:hypothetical protein
LTETVLLATGETITAIRMPPDMFDRMRKLLRASWSQRKLVNAFWRATIAAGALFLEKIKHYYYSFQMPNASAHLLPKAEA